METPHRLALADFLKLLNSHSPKFTQKNKPSFYGMLINMGLLLVLCIPSLSDSTQPSNFGPNGEDCIQRSEIHESYYDYTDENGLHCLRQLCRSGHILKKNSTCDPNNLEQPQHSECGPVLRGHFMNSSNFCSRGFECKKCLHPLKVRNKCRRHGPDTVCSCVDGYHKTSPDTCLPIPKCDAGYEPKSGHGDHGTEIRCTPCSKDSYQPNSNSTLRCKRVRQCTVRNGTRHSDAVCLNDQPVNDQTLEPIQRPTNGYVTTEAPTESDHGGSSFLPPWSDTPVTTPVPTPGTPVPTPGHDEISPVGPTTHLTTNNSGDSCSMNVLTGGLCLFFFVLGICVGCFIHRAYGKRGTYVLPMESNQLMSGLEENERADGLSV